MAKAKSIFESMPTRQRGSATRLLNDYYREIDAWQQQLNDFGGISKHPLVQLKEYLGLTDFEAKELQSYSALKAVLSARRNDIYDRIASMRKRAMMNAQISKDGVRYGHGLDKDGTYLPDGVYVYFAVAFNHGAGALFLGYVDSSYTPDDLTHIQDWSTLPAINDMEDFI